MLHDARPQRKKPVNGVPSEYPVFDTPSPQVWIHLESRRQTPQEKYVQDIFDTMLGMRRREESDSDSCI